MTADTVVALGIVRNPECRAGRPTVQGTRIAVEQVLNLLAHGESVESRAYQYCITPDQVYVFVDEPSDEGTTP